jgi:outer membrane protein assembly factor BamE (lipoprotein component of BamABCDE complex)
MDCLKYGRFYAFLLIAFCMFLFSCSTARIIKREDIAKIEVGRTTKQEVVSALGLPNQRTVKGENERWVYFKEATQVTTSIGTVGSFKHTYKTAVPMTQIETNTQNINPNVAAIVWLDKFGTVVELIQGDLK